MQNFNEKINLIWSIAETLRGIYKPEKYGDIILPLCVIRRFDCILEEKKDEVLALYEEYKDLSENNLLMPTIQDCFVLIVPFLTSFYYLLKIE